MRHVIALCLGGARHVWDDLDAALRLVGRRRRMIVACNFAGIAYAGRLDAWVTLHPDMFGGWRAARAAAGRNDDYRAICQRGSGDHEVMPARWRGSSGLFMAQAALERLGASGVILCGAPMDDAGGHIHWDGAWTDAALYRRGFEQAASLGLPIRSMSGWSARLFGAPDADWTRGVYEGESMAWVVFHQHFDWSPTRALIQAHSPHPSPRCVTRACADAAVAAGKATRVRTPTRAARAALEAGRGV